MQGDRPLITAVIPTYQRPDLLQRAIRSVLAQTYGHLRVRVYDNASDDGTASIVEALAGEDSRVAYHRHPENIGSVANFAYGMERVETPFFSVLSDDDYYHPQFYEAAMDGFTRYPEAMFSAGRTILAYDNGYIQMGAAEDKYFPPPDNFLLWTSGKGPAVTGMVYRQEVIAQAGVADHHIFHWDVEYIWRLAAQFPFVISSQPGIIHTVYTDRQPAIDTAVQSYLLIRARVQNTPGPTEEVRLKTEQFLRAWFSQAVLHAGLCAIRDGEYRSGQRAAALLHTQFRQNTRAILLNLLAQTCMRIPLLRRSARTTTSALLRVGTTLLQARRGKHSNHRLQSEIGQFVREMNSI